MWHGRSCRSFSLFGQRPGFEVFGSNASLASEEAELSEIMTFPGESDSLSFMNEQVMQSVEPSRPGSCPVLRGDFGALILSADVAAEVPRADTLEPSLGLEAAFDDVLLEESLGI